MSIQSIFSAPWRRYGLFILWGLLEGILVYLVISETGGGSYRGNLSIAIACVVSGGTLSALVFGILSRLPQSLRAGGFLIVGILTPWFAILGAQMLYCSCFDMTLDWIGTIVTLLWTAFSLPFSILSAALYFFIWLLFKIRNRRQSAPV